MPASPRDAARTTATLAAGALVALQITGKATRDGEFLAQFPVTLLPFVSAMSAALSLGASLGFARLVARLSPARALERALWLLAVVLGVEWALAPGLPRGVAIALYVQQAMLGATLLSAFWAAVTERFDPHAARQEIGAIGSGANLGGIAGGLGAWLAAGWGGGRVLLLLMAGLSVLGARLARRLGASIPEPAGSDSAPEARSGLRLIREVPYLGRLALLVGLAAFADAALDYSLSAVAASRLADERALLSFFALFHGVTGALGFAVQAALTRPALARLGLAPTLAAQPAFTLLAGLAVPLLPQGLGVIGLRGGATCLRNSLFRSSYELLYTPLPRELKRPSKVIVDVACDRLGTILGSLAVAAGVALAPGRDAGPGVPLAVAAAGLCLLLAPVLRRGYVGALAASLRSGALRLERSAVTDATTLHTLAVVLGEGPGAAAAAGGAPLAAAAPVPRDPLLSAISALRSGDPARIETVVAGPNVDPAVLPHLLPLLASERLFGLALPGLRRIAPRCTGQFVDTLLDPAQDPVVRRRMPRVLAAVPSAHAVAGLLLGLREESLDLRYRCAQALVAIRARDGALQLPTQEILAAVEREAGRLGEPARGLDTVFLLLGLALEREPVQAAREALRLGDGPLRGTALEYLHNVLPSPLRERLWPWLARGAPVPESGRSAQALREDLLRATTAWGAGAAARPADEPLEP